MPDRDALEAALDELYDVDPSEFTATRTRLAVALRTVDADAAKRLTAARRPTTAAWVLNRLSRDEPALVSDYLDRSEALRDAQAGARDGGRDALRDATRAQRDALARLTDAALGRLGDRANDGYRAQVVATLHAAVVDDAVGEELRKGRLVKEVSGASGFPSGPELSVVPPLPAEKPAKRKPPKRRTARGTDGAEPAKEEPPPEPAQDVAKDAERAARQERAQRDLAEAEQAAVQARADADAAEAAASAAHERARQLEQDLDRAKREAREADTAAARSRRDAAQLARTATRLRSRTGGG